jgi:tRNA-dihydrouridine synthase A
MQSGVSIPVTVKCRIGIDDEDSYDFFENFIRLVHGAGCRTFIVHARKAVLSGFSPKDNREIPPLKYNYVYEIQAAMPDTLFILNGGLKTGSQVREQLQIVKGVMLGRAVYSNPYLLAELENQVFATPKPGRNLIAAMYRDYMNEKIKSGTHLKHMVKHMLGLYAGIPGARAYRRYLSENMFGEHAGIEVLDKALELIQDHSESEPVGSMQAESS